MTVLSGPYERAGGMIAAATVTLALAGVLALGLAVRGRAASDPGDTAVFDVREETPTSVQRVARRDTRRSGRAAPPDLTSRATPLVTPPPVMSFPIPPQMTVAEQAAEGFHAVSGAVPIAGPGSGAGGVGDGFGGGGQGEGDGAGDPDATPPRQIRGRIRDADYPRDLADAGGGGRVTVLFLVERDGRVTDCEIAESSGMPRLDMYTCRLIRERFRFRPSRDGQGRVVRAWVEETHEWVVERAAVAE